MVKIMVYETAPNSEWEIYKVSLKPREISIFDEEQGHYVPRQHAVTSAALVATCLSKAAAEAVVRLYDEYVVEWST